MATSPAISTRPGTLRDLINPTERQQEFFEKCAQFDFVLYEGEASGGKSYALRWWLLDFLVDCYQTRGLASVVVGLFSEDYPTLKDRQLSKIRVEFPPWLGSLRRTDGGLDFVLRPEYGSGAIALRNLDDPSKYFSAEFAAVAIEELTKHPLSVFNDMRFRLRWPGIERPKFGAATNPGGIGHPWVKKYWITKEYPAEFIGVVCRLCRRVWVDGCCPKCKSSADGNPFNLTKQFAKVTARACENPHIPENYHTRNLTLPPDMARRVAHGDWNVYTGQWFPQFEQSKHVIPAAEAIKRIKPWHTTWISGDWGFEHPACFHVHAKDEHNRITTFGELWDRRVGELEWGQRITRTWGHLKLKSFPFSWDAGRLSPRSGAKYPKSIVQLVSDALGAAVPKPHPADSSPGSRMSGYRLMSQLLEAEVGGRPMWQIADNCPKLIECLPILIRDEDDPEQVLKVDYAEGDTIGDDPADSARMGLQHEFGSVVVPVSVVAERKVAVYAETRGKDVEELDINTVAQLHRRALAQEQRKRRQRRGGLGRIWRPPTGVN